MRRDIEPGLKRYITQENIAKSIYDCIYSKTDWGRGMAGIRALKTQIIEFVNEYLLNLLLFIYDKKGTITLNELIIFIKQGVTEELLFEQHIRQYNDQVIINDYAIQEILTEILNTLNTTIAAAPLSKFMNIDFIQKEFGTTIASAAELLGSISFSELFKGDISVLSGCIESSLVNLKSISEQVGGFTKVTKRKTK